MIKDFISDQDGLYKDPFNAAVIKGDNLNTNLISKYVSDPFAVISPYGAKIVPAGTSKTNSKGNIAVEIPFNNNEMNYAQEGGAASQQQQIVQQVAQMLQQGADPQQVMKQLVDMGIPSEDAEQLLTSVMQMIEQQMSEQQQMQDEEMGGEDDMPMAMYGGEEFPQANPYPHMYADGGEAFPQAQTYLPYDRGGDPIPNFMFEYGGNTDINQAYQMMKRGGFDMNPKKKKGGKFTDETFDEYVMRNGGDLPIHQWKQSQTGFGFGQPDATQVYRPNNQQSFADQYPAAMQNIMNATQSMNQQARPGVAQSAAGARTAGSASGVRRPSAVKSAAAPVASGSDFSTINPIYAPERSTEEELVDYGGPNNYDEGSGYDQSSGYDIPTVTMDKEGNITPNKQQDKQQDKYQGNYNPMQAYTTGKNAANLFGTKGAAGLGLLSFIPGFGAAASNAGPTGGFFGRADKLKGNVVGPYGSFTGKIKGRDNISAMFNSLSNPPQKQVGGNSDWEYTYYDRPAGMEDVGGSFAFQSGIDTGIEQKKLKEQQNKLRNQDTVSSGIAMGPMAAKTPGNAAVGTTNSMGAVNPFMSGQPGNFGLGTYGSSMLSNAKFGGNILDQFQDGAEVDLDGMSEQEIRDFVNAIYAAGGTVEYL